MIQNRDSSPNTRPSGQWWWRTSVPQCRSTLLLKSHSGIWPQAQHGFHRLQILRTETQFISFLSFIVTLTRFSNDFVYFLSKHSCWFFFQKWWVGFDGLHSPSSWLYKTFIQISNKVWKTPEIGRFLYSTRNNFSKPIAIINSLYRLIL